MKIIEGFSLSPLQLRIWHKTRRARYTFFIRLAQPIPGERLQELVAQLASQSELMRTVYPLPDAMTRPVQVIVEKEPFWLEPSSIVNLSEAQSIEQLGSKFPQQDVPEIPPLQLCQGLGTDGPCLLAVNLPALSLDPSVPGIFCTALEQAHHGTLPQEATMQYADFAQWQIDNLKEAKHSSEWAHLQNKPGASMPFEAADAEPGPIARLAVKVPDNVKVTEDTSDFLMACWQVLLSRFCGESSWQLGFYGHGRDFEELTRALGVIGQYLPLAMSRPADLSFADLMSSLKNLREQAVEAQTTFFEQLHEDKTLFRYGFASHETQPGDVFSLQQSGLPAEPLVLGLTSIFTGKEIQLYLDYDSNRLTAEHAEVMVASLQTLLADASTRPRLACDRLKVLAPDELRLMVESFNATEQVQADTAETLTTLFERQVAATPDLTAVGHSGMSLSYKQLNAKANALAYYLKQQGLGLEDRVGICMARGVEMIIAVWGVLKTGAAYLPTEPDDPPDRQRFILNHGRVNHLLVLGPPSNLHLPSELPILDLASFDFAAYPQDNLNHIAHPQSSAYVIYTSGSTGKPKGVLIEHRAPINLRNAMNKLVYHGLEGQQRITLNAPLSFDASMQQISMMTLGHHLEIVPQQTRFDGKAFIAFLATHEISVLDITPDHLSLLLDAGLLEHEHLNLQRVNVAGGAVLQTMWDRLAQAPIGFFNLYGPTECTINATGNAIEGEGRNPSIGPPLANYQVYILDRHANVKPRGTSGQLAIGGDGLARCYTDRPAQTAEQFIPNPYSTRVGARLYLSGDLAQHGEKGGLEFKGRIDSQIKIRGYRIELGEIETIMAQHLKVLRVFALAHPVSEAADANLQLIAYYEPLGDQVSAQELQQFLAPKLPYYMVPTLLIPVKPMPLTPNGKIDRAALPTPEESQNTYVAPTNDREAQLATIWSQVLGLESPSVNADFYSLGGHSLTVMTCVTQINETFACEISLRDFFEHTTIVELAECINKAQDVALESDEASALLAELGELSEDEIKAMLAEESSDGNP